MRHSSRRFDDGIGGRERETESGVSVAAVIDGNSDGTRFVAQKSYPTMAMSAPFDSVVITNVRNAHKLFNEVVKLFGLDRVLVPKLLGAWAVCNVRTLCREQSLRGHLVRRADASECRRQSRAQPRSSGVRNLRTVRRSSRDDCMAILLDMLG
jgi:hypothetical protein